ncbi:MAG TPA: adenylate/guanylate cyclase domain-containing protein [Stellaceae bacterium]|nr:adenylate/guanylate cyclase domain-containing protein [Stellaceae bacterium]
MPRDFREALATSGAPSLDGVLAALDSWLIREARFLPGNSELLEQFCERVAASGVAIDRVSLHQRAFHPQYRGVSRVWRRDGPLEERFLDHGIERTALYLQSPVREAIEEVRSVEWRLEGCAKLPYPLLDELREEGYTHYLIAPLVYSVGTVNAFSWATRRQGGFDAAERQLFHDVQPGLATVAELKAMRRFVASILTTYVGNEAGKLILDGQVQRGDVREITAALMLIDLRDFSAMSDRLSSRAVIRLLNDYFDCVMEPIRAQGGEVVEIMGDGVLAIFQQADGGSPADACSRALAAAIAGLDALAARNRQHPTRPLHAGFALHYGTVSYGNIGSGDRMDFTVIGPDVNLTSRIERLCRELDRSLIMSEAFAETVHRPMWEIGHFEMRGFAKMQRLFELPPTEFA